MKGFCRYFFFCFVVLVFAISGGCASVAKRPAPLTIPQIVQLSREGVPSSEIIDRMKRSGRSTSSMQAGSPDSRKKVFPMR